jgi:N-acetyl-alpha-D-muramate 1-phosphate uridylyltransferase
MQAVILAGGLATRLGALARDRPKSLIEVGGRPFLAWQLERLARSGFSDVLLCIGHLGAQIRAFAGDGSAFGLRVRCREDGPRALGTAGALRAALDELAPEFLVTYGDSYLPFDYSTPLTDLRAHPEAEGSMAVFRNDGRWDRSNTAVSGEHVVRYEKGSNDAALDHIDYGATALRREVIARLPPGASAGLDRIQGELAAAGTLRACRATTRFYEIGSEAGLAELDALLRAETGRG